MKSKNTIFIVLLIALLVSLTLLVCVSCDNKMDECAVTFVADGVTVKVVKCKKDATAVDEPSVPNKHGYTGAWESYSLNGKDLTVNAVYTAKQYTVIFNYNGSESVYQTHTTVTFDKSVGVLPEPTKTDNYFAGWYLGNERIASESIWTIDSDDQMVLTAKWLPSSQALTYSYNKYAMTCTVTGVNYNDSLKDIIVPSYYNGYKVTAIADRAFSSKSYLLSVYIPEGITSIGNGLFSSSRNIEKVTVASGNTNYYSEGNCIVSKSNKAVIAGTSNSTVPISATSIANSAFSGVEISYLTLPSSIVRIGDSAFSGCTSLISVTIPNTVTSLGNSVFRGCTSLSSVEFGVNSVLTVIPQNAFYGCRNLARIDVPDGVTEIGAYAFTDCYRLHDVNFGKNSKCLTIGDSAFSNCADLTSIVLPNKLTSLGNEVFKYCSHLTDITIPASLRAIPELFEYSYRNLENVYYGGTIADWCALTFDGYWGYRCNPMYFASRFYLQDGSGQWQEQTEIVIPNTVTEIGDYQFYGFSNVTTLTIPSSVAKIGTQAFYECHFTNLYYDGSWAEFRNIQCDSGSNLQQYTDNLYFKDNGEWTQLTELIIPEGTTEIADFEYRNFKSITSVVIPSSVKTIGQGAFYDCTGLKTVVIENGVAALPSSMFYNCESLESITIPSSVISVGYNAFYNCKKLASVYFDGALDNWIVMSLDGGFYNFKSTVDKSLYVKSSNDWELVTDVVIPDDVHDLRNNQLAGFSCITSVTFHDGVRSVGDYAFAGCTGLTDIALPSSLLLLGEGAFNGCVNLQSVTFAQGCQIKYINAFVNCPSLTAITIPDSVTVIGEYAFSDCVSLENVFFGEDSQLVEIESGAFYGCKALTSFCFPINVEIIGYDLFAECSSLESLSVADGNETYHSYGNCIITNTTKRLILGCKNSVLPTDGSVLYIWHNAFAHCDGLTSIVIPESISYIDDYAFAHSGLTSVTIPTSVTELGYGIFEGCESLTTIYYLGTVEQWQKINHWYWYEGSAVTKVVCSDGVIEVEW